MSSQHESPLDHIAVLFCLMIGIKQCPQGYTLIFVEHYWHAVNVQRYVHI